MRPPLIHRRRGMSLVELLVVVAILGLLVVTVLPSVASTTESRRTAAAAQVATAFIASAQTRALGRREWSGFRVVPTAGGSNVALDLKLVDAPAAYRGDTMAAAVHLPPPVAGMTTGTATITTGSFSAAVEPGNLVRFGGRDPWYAVAAATATEVTFTRRSNVGQSDTNTPWPPTGIQPFEIDLEPIPYGAAVTLGEGRVIDLRWSGIYDGAFTPPFDAGAITVLYDGTGRLRQVVHPGNTGGETTVAPRALFFLVGRADRAGETNPGTFDATDDTTGCNWQYSDSYWVMINPATGSVYQASCDTTTNDPVASQSFVRSYLSVGGGG
jgi:prepilin-type N-terminal cleavage/methylation domain-containing protein